ncbi:Polysaccharide deacetylase [Desulfosarcina cetonica]|uniref:polysaccharide deacetylase family protein n=1 Tax=Desulfosarcina cetonica TaxID=90730 RepID=UPI0006D07F54|nr:polysaccharide deacetylase family protein [Desulfosarcina cetonica]VTR64633.1 Polysaccharide deacetylase [Desulfosarcina cetonica]
MALYGSHYGRAYRGVSLALIGMAVLAGCAGPVGIGPLPGSTVYRSSERVLHRFQPGETPAMLAAKYLGDAGLAWMIEDANPKAAFTPQQLVVVPLTIANRAGIGENGYQSVPILCYHRFAKTCDSSLCMPADIFERQLRYLKTNGYRVIGADALLDFLQYRRAIPKKAVMITMDDGYRSTFDVAYPLLKKYGFTATLFIYTDYVGVSRQAITWDQLRELKREGFTIGSHSIAHSDLSKPKNGEDRHAYMIRLQREIIHSKQIIDKALNQDTIAFAYPFGRRNPAVVSLSRQAGYQMGMTVDRGSNPFFADPFTVRRDQILKRDMGLFSARLKTFTKF